MKSKAGRMETMFESGILGVNGAFNSFIQWRAQSCLKQTLVLKAE